MNDTPEPSAPQSRLDRRALLGAAAGAALVGTAGARQDTATAAAGKGVLVGSANALEGMRQYYAELERGADPLDVAVEVVKLVEADPTDMSVGLGGLPNEEGHVTLDAAVMHGPTHNAGAVFHLENILHPVQVARLVMERTDHVQLVGEGAYRFARMHGHEHVELLTEQARRAWVRWRENLSDKDDRLPPPDKDRRGGQLIRYMGEEVALDDVISGERRLTGTIHCSALSIRGEVACCTTTSGLSWKVPGRVGDSSVIGAGLYCDQEAGSAGATGRGEAAILSAGSAMCVELMRSGKTPEEAGLEVLRRVTRQAQRASAWQPALVDDQGRPAFNLQYYVLGLDGTVAGVELRGSGQRAFACATPGEGPRRRPLVPLHRI